MTTFAFTEAQRRYLSDKLGSSLLVAYEGAINLGQAALFEPLVKPKLSADDWAKVASLLPRIEAVAQPVSTGFPGGATVQGAMPGPVGNGLALAIDTIALKLTTARNVHPGAAKEYREGKVTWPTVDAFGRPFPSLAAIAAMKTADAREHVTGSGFPKHRLDGMFYMVHRKDGNVGVISFPNGIMQVGDADKALPPSPAIAAYAWRGYNLGQGTEARFWDPAMHPLVAKVRLVVPTEYTALMAARATAPAAVAPGAAVTKRRRTASPIA